MTITLRHKPAKSPDDVRLGQVNFNPILVAAATTALSGSPAAVSVGSTEITVSGVGYNSTAVTIRGQTVPAQQAVQFTVAGGTAGSEYTVKVTAYTSNETFVRNCRVMVV